MILLEDLIVDNQADSVVESIGVENEESFSEKPTKCLHCKSRKMEAIEVLGAIDAKGLWTSPLDWGFKERDLFS
jgi:hypothetical protein